MISPYKKLNIPREEKLFILPEPREKLFIDLINQYKKRYPDLKLIYGYLNHDSSLSIDYVLIFHMIESDVIIFDIPYIYTDRAIPGYRYCKKNHIENDFFEEAYGLMTRLSYPRFNEYLTIMCNLSLDSKNELYWQNPKNSMTLCKGLVDLSLRYNKKN